jgi:hypothetical protein
MNSERSLLATEASLLKRATTSGSSASDSRRNFTASSSPFAFRAA